MAPDVTTSEVRLPLSLALVADGERRIEVEGATLREALADLARRRPKLGLHLFDESGALRRHVRCFCNAQYASHREGLDQPLKQGDTITLLNSVAGG
jgi:molybdopterin converting factor small subunit